MNLMRVFLGFYFRILHVRFGQTVGLTSTLLHKKALVGLARYVPGLTKAVWLANRPNSWATDLQREVFRLAGTI